MKCRHCRSEVTLLFVDLGASPPSNSYLSADDLSAPERYYPLRVLVCTSCWLVQTEDFAKREDLFATDYAYFSSYSTSWLQHAEEFVKIMVSRLGLSGKSLVVEIAANDGYLLQYVNARKIPSYGIEPTASTAEAARGKGIEIIEDFFGVRLAKKLAKAGRQADLTVANNVLAHVPDVNDFVAGFFELLKPNGVATFEFPHVLNLVEQNQFDTIYHEHYSYLSLSAVKTVFSSNGLSIFDVERIGTHGGSLRVFAQRSDRGTHEVSHSVANMLEYESMKGVCTIPFYAGFQERANKVKNDFLFFLIEAYRQGKKVAAYGAAAKGNTLLNYGGVRPDLVRYVVDRNREKQGKYLPGSRIPIVAEDYLQHDKPDYIVILPWNLLDEVMGQLAYVRAWNGKFVIAVPELNVCS